MRPFIVEIPIENFTKFFEGIHNNHHNGQQHDYYLHRLNSYQKNYSNQILESYYGLHYMGISQNDKNNYCFSITDKKLYLTSKLKFGI